MKKLNKKGFTLVEMLVVIAIIAVLVAIIIPTTSSATTKAKAATDAANLRSLTAEATIDYLEDNELNTQYKMKSKLFKDENDVNITFYNTDNGLLAVYSSGSGSNAVTATVDSFSAAAESGKDSDAKDNAVSTKISGLTALTVKTNTPTPKEDAQQ